MGKFVKQDVAMWQCKNCRRKNQAHCARCHWCHHPREVEQGTTPRTSTCRKCPHEDTTPGPSQSMQPGQVSRAKSHKVKIIRYTGPPQIQIITNNTTQRGRNKHRSTQRPAYRDQLDRTPPDAEQETRKTLKATGDSKGTAMPEPAIGASTLSARTFLGMVQGSG